VTLAIRNRAPGGVRGAPCAERGATCAVCEVRSRITHHRSGRAIMGAMTDSTSFSTRVFGLVSVGIIGVGLFLVLKPFLGPLLWAALLAMLLFPANVTLRRGLGWSMPKGPTLRRRD
jgi:hypothetical protein